MSRQKTSSFLSADTPEFDVEAIEGWWLTKGIKRYSKNKLLILVDGGGSNGHRCHMWKIKIQENSFCFTCAQAHRYSVDNQLFSITEAGLSRYIYANLSVTPRAYTEIDQG